ncbi:hypothetical protein [Seinonella peptonophila]|nr:hypothetical protein [Seinonella peptonophila]
MHNNNGNNKNFVTWSDLLQAINVFVAIFFGLIATGLSLFSIVIALLK